MSESAQQYNGTTFINRTGRLVRVKSIRSIDHQLTIHLCQLVVSLGVVLLLLLLLLLLLSSLSLSLSLSLSRGGGTTGHVGAND
jgi:hypothetical protein